MVMPCYYCKTNEQYNGSNNPNIEYSCGYCTQVIAWQWEDEFNKREEVNKQTKPKQKRAFRIPVKKQTLSSAKLKKGNGTRK
jgi:hypothetical protein